MPKTAYNKLMQKDDATKRPINLADLVVPVYGVTVSGPELAELLAVPEAEVLEVMEVMGEAAWDALERRKRQRAREERKPKGAASGPSGKDKGAPYLERRANGRPIIFAPVPGSSMGRMMDPEVDAADARKEIAKYAKRTRRDAAWVRAKELELGVANG